MGLDLNYQLGQTPLEEEEKEGLLIETISTMQELDEFEQLNIEKAIEWTIRNKFKLEKILTEGFIKQVHEKMYNEVWKWAGEFRKTDKNIGVNWIQIGIELRYLLDDTNYWIKNKTYSDEEIAIRFKHRIVKIHCFPNGNGRHSRLMADIIMENIFKKPAFSWGFKNRLLADE
ncbi:MAG: mobile mystery protein B, partial [Flavobacterium sp.]|nr:mobile mystery protein B [Flavobacterium sp.]